MKETAKERLFCKVLRNSLTEAVIFFVRKRRFVIWAE